jgi:uncharacterized protein DUF2154
MLKRTLVLLVTVVTVSCSLGSGSTGPTQHETANIDLDASDKARVELQMNAGELQVTSGSTKLAEADFVYNVAAWKPDVVYHAGVLKITQPNGAGGCGGRTENTWKVTLNNKLPVDLRANLGAGDATLTLGAMNLTRVQVEVGAGELKLDLRGNPAHDYDVQVRGGVGQATVYLPKDVAISATATGGIGGISAEGLEKRDGIWMNPSRATAPVTVHVDAKGGVGEIRLVR